MTNMSSRSPGTGPATNTNTSYNASRPATVDGSGSVHHDAHAHPGQVALTMARRGWPVLPCAVATKRPLIPRTETRPGGRSAATRDPLTITRWWSRWPRASLAIVPIPGVIGVDLDLYRREGEDLYRRLSARAGALPPTWVSTSRTDGSGIRLYRHTGTPTWADPGTGVDLIHAGTRYVMCAPSAHPSGRTYRWISPTGTEHTIGPTPDDLPWLPAAWLAVLTVQTVRHRESTYPVRGGGSRVRRGPVGGYSAAALSGAVRAAATAPVGTRASTLNRQSYSLGGLVAAGVMDQDLVVGELVAAGISSGLSEREARAIVASGLRAGMARPRSVVAR